MFITHNECCHLHSSVYMRHIWFQPHLIECKCYATLAYLRCYSCCKYSSFSMQIKKKTQITSLAIVYSNVYSGADQRKHQSPTSLAFVTEIHRSPVNSPHKWPVTRKMFPFDDVIMSYKSLVTQLLAAIISLLIIPLIVVLHVAVVFSGGSGIMEFNNKGSTSTKLNVSMTFMRSRCTEIWNWFEHIQYIPSRLILPICCRTIAPAPRLCPTVVAKISSFFQWS